MIIFWDHLPNNSLPLHLQFRSASEEAKPNLLGSPSNQGQNHRISGMERHGGHLLQIPSDTLISAQHFCSILEGSINNVCMCTDTHKHVCTHTYTHIFSLSSSPTTLSQPIDAFPTNVILLFGARNNCKN